MHAVIEAREILRAIPREHDESKLAWLVRAGRFFGLTFSQAKKIEYRELKDMRASRLDAMRERFNELQERAQSRRELHDALAVRTAALRSGLGSAEAAGDRRGAPQAGRRGDGAVAGGARKA